MPDNEELLNEDSLFDDAVDGVETTPEPTPEPAAAEQATAPEPETVAKPSTEDDDDIDDDGSPVPSGRFRQAQEAKRAARAERDALKQERDRLLGEQQEFRRWMMSQQQKPVEPERQQQQPDEPDPLLDPRGYRDFLERRFEERLLNERREYSLQNAREKYQQEFDEAYAVAQKQVDPALRARMQQSANPGETLIGWFRELKVRAEVGNDPKAYREKVRAEFLKDPEFRKAAMEAWRGEAVTTGRSGRPTVQLSPSLNGVSRSNAAVRASQEDFSDDALWDQTTT